MSPFSTEWHASRRVLLLKRMQEERVDCVILSNSPTPTNLFYFTGFETTTHRTLTLVFLTADGNSVLLVPALRADQAAQYCRSIPRQVCYTDHDDLPSVFHRISSMLHLRQGCIFALDENLEFHKFQLLRAAFPQSDFRSANSLLEPIMTVKTPEEQRLLREGHQLTDEVYEEALTQARPGMREIDFRNLVEQGFFRRGFDGGLLNGIAFGSDTAYAQWVSGPQTIQPGNPAYCDLGAVRNHYWTDMTRCFTLGEPDPDYRKLYQICLEGQQIAEKTVRPGRTLHEIHWATGDYFRQEGVLQYWPVRVGHGVGLLANEAPSVCDGSRTLLVPGMVITIEPTLHIPGRFGVRVENTVLVTETGCEPLSQSPLELRIL